MKIRLKSASSAFDTEEVEQLEDDCENGNDDACETLEEF